MEEYLNTLVHFSSCIVFSTELTLKMSEVAQGTPTEEGKEKEFGACGFKDFTRV